MTAAISLRYLAFPLHRRTPSLVSENFERLDLVTVELPSCTSVRYSRLGLRLVLTSPKQGLKFRRRRPKKLELVRHARVDVSTSASATPISITGERMETDLNEIKCRSSKEIEPNRIVLEALSRVCTGPKKTKPLDGSQAELTLQTILQSVNGEIAYEHRVSAAQMGAFFGAMTLRANSFPQATQWSEAEQKAMLKYWPSLSQYLPDDIIFVADPEGAFFGGSKRSKFYGRVPSEMRLVRALREVLSGGHLEFEEVASLLREILPLEYFGRQEGVSHALVAAFLIGQRMNTETDSELKAYCMAFDDELGTSPIVDISSLTHYGDPYDGNTRFFRSTLFVAALRASYGESGLLHGVDWMPPKGGVTDEQMLRCLGGATTLVPTAAVKLLEDEEVGFGYISQREARPAMYSLVDLRRHIKKRPPIATTEKVQRYITASGREAMIGGFYHEGYESPLLMLMQTRGVDAGLVIKGEEGALSLTTFTPPPSAVLKGKPMNYCAGFRPAKAGAGSTGNHDGFLHETFSFQADASKYGFKSSPTPRTDRSTVRNVELGLAALHGQQGPAYDRIVWNAAVADHLLGCDGASDLYTAIERAKHAIDSGRGLKHLLAYVQKSCELQMP